MKAVAIDRQMCKSIRSELDAAFGLIQEKLGVKLRIGSISFAQNGSRATAKLEMLGTDQFGDALTPERKALNEVVKQLPWLANRVGHPFMEGKNKYQLTGYNRRAPKYPFIMTCVDGPKKGSSQRSTESYLKSKFGVQ